MNPSVRYTLVNRVATLTLNQPTSRNALGTELIQDLTQIFERIGDEKQVKVVLLKSEGSAFCAGANLADIKNMQSSTFEENLKNSSQLRQLFQTLYTCPKPTVAQVQGPAIAGGCGLVACCDFVWASQDSFFACTEVRIGFVPALIMPFLLRRVGETWAKYLMVSGRRLSASQAKSIGLVHEVVASKDLETEVSKFVDELVKKNAGQSMEMVKKLFVRMQDMPLEEALRYAMEINASARASEDCKRGIQAFLEKKQLDWSAN